VVEKGATSIKGANKSFNIPLISMFDNLNGRKTKKFGPHGVLSKEEKINVVDWIFGM
jgi:hypothetical protein